GGNQHLGGTLTEVSDPSYSRCHRTRTYRFDPEKYSAPHNNLRRRRDKTMLYYARLRATLALCGAAHISTSSITSVLSRYGRKTIEDAKLPQQNILTPASYRACAPASPPSCP